MITFEKIDLHDYEPSAPEDEIYFDTDFAGVAEQEESVLDILAPAEMIALFHEAKEKHLPIMFTNNDKTRAVLIKDANDLSLKISVNGIPFAEI